MLPRYGILIVLDPFSYSHRIKLFWNFINLVKEVIIVRMKSTSKVVKSASKAQIYDTMNTSV